MPATRPAGIESCPPARNGCLPALPSTPVPGPGIATTKGVSPLDAQPTVQRARAFVTMSAAVIHQQPLLPCIQRCGGGGRWRGENAGINAPRSTRSTLASCCGAGAPPLAIWPGYHESPGAETLRPWPRRESDPPESGRPNTPHQAPTSTGQGPLDTPRGRCSPRPARGWRPRVPITKSTSALISSPHRDHERLVLPCRSKITLAGHAALLEVHAACSSSRATARPSCIALPPSSTTRGARTRPTGMLLGQAPGPPQRCHRLAL